MIRLENLQVQAGDFSLTVSDLAVTQGEYVMVLGPTASGKTVLLETIAGLRRPQNGRVWFDEREVTGEPPERRGAGLVYQDYALFPHLTVAANIGFGLRARRMRGSGSRARGASGRDDDARVQQLAGLLGIDGLLDRYPEGLSGGEQQRVALARALAIGPDVLLLDEPLSALDAPTRQELQGELRRLHGELGATVMHVTHDLDEALALGDRMAVLIDGEFRQTATPQSVTRHPADVDVARLVGLANIFPVLTMTERRGGGGEARPAPRDVVLENGLEVLSESVAPLPASSRLFAVVRSEEIEIERNPDRSGRVSPGETEGLTDGFDGACANVFTGFVRGVQMQSIHASVEVEVKTRLAAEAPPVLTVHVLRPQVEKLGLAAGAVVNVTIPPSAVHLCAGPAGASGA